jgi:hypothetical protein
MHSFSEIIGRCTAFTLGALDEVNERTINALQTSGATTLVKTLQMIRLQKTLLAVGIFSLFEATLQDTLNCKNGFAEAKKILNQGRNVAILELFTDIELAINVLKHGRGKSYDALIAKGGGTLRPYVKQLNEQIFDESDVSEIATLIDVDDKFIYLCGEVIEQVSKIIRNERPDALL